LPHPQTITKGRLLRTRTPNGADLAPDALYAQLRAAQEEGAREAPGA
jgi:hypothetical protein